MSRGEKPPSPPKKTAIPAKKNLLWQFLTRRGQVSLRRGPLLLRPPRRGGMLMWRGPLQEKLGGDKIVRRGDMRGSFKIIIWCTHPMHVVPWIKE
jgi:hypothetical protein